MNNSPFELFRRNLKPMMIFLTGLALFAFVVLPVLDTYMRRNAGMAGDRVVARFDGQELTQNRVEYFTQNHLATLQFLSALAQETMNRQGSPRTAGFELDPRTGQIQSVGINPQPSAEGTIRTFLFSAQAQKAGFDLSDNDLAIWLEQFTDGLLSNGEIDGMLMKMTQNRMGRPHLYEQLRHHMLSQVYLTRGYAGLGAMTPEEQWTNFLKLNQDAVASTYEILVNEYIDKTNATPSEEQIREMYEKGKDRDPSDQSAEPAFHRRYSAKFEYLVGSYDKFLREEIEKLTEEQLRAEYQRRLDGGDFQLPETPVNNAPSSADPAADESASSDAPASRDESEAENAASGKASSPSTDGEASEDTSAEGDGSETSEAAAPANGETSSEPASEEGGAEPESNGSESSGDAAAEDQSSNVRQSAVRLVSLQEEATQESEEASQGEEKAEGESAEGNESATETNTEAASDTQTDANADAASNSDSGANTETASDDSAEAKADDTPKVESFEDVRKSLEASLAGPAARKRWNEVMASVEGEMKNYFSEQAIYESQVMIGEEGEPPAKPDMEAVAKKYGLEHEVIGPYDVLTIRDEPIANTFEMSSQFGGRAPTFTQIMYTLSQDGSPSKPLWSPLRTEDAAAGKQYVSWKIEQTAAYTPSLDDEGVRDEVVLAIREEEARKLAMAAAEEIAKKAAAEPDKPLKDFVPAEERDQFLKEGLGPFKWMNMFGFSGATIGNVPELNSVGDDFMKAVFTTDVNGVSAAMNQNGQAVYVVKPTAFSPAPDELREQFKQPTNRMMTRMLGNNSNEVVAEFFESVDEAADFKDYLTNPEE